MKHVMSERRGKLIEMKKTKRLWAKYTPYLNSTKHVMAEGGSKLKEMKKDRTPRGEVRTLGKKHLMAEGGSKLIEMKRVRTLGKKH